MFEAEKRMLFEMANRSEYDETYEAKTLEASFNQAETELIQLRAEVERLKLKADNWDIIRWAVNEEIGFVGLYEGIGLEVTNLDLEMLMKLYESREQKDGAE